MLPIHVISVRDETERRRSAARLQHDGRARSTPIVLLGPFQLERHTKLPHCAMCYALTPRIAERLLSMSRKFTARFDVVMKRVWRIGHPMYCLTPYTVSDSALCRDSVIGTRRRCRKPVGIRLRRTVMKIGWLLKRWRFNLRQTDRRLRECRYGANPTANGKTAVVARVTGTN